MCYGGQSQRTLLSNEQYVNLNVSVYMTTSNLCIGRKYILTGIHSSCEIIQAIPTTLVGDPCPQGFMGSYHFFYKYFSYIARQLINSIKYFLSIYTEREIERELILNNFIIYFIEPGTVKPSYLFFHSTGA